MSAVLTVCSAVKHRILPALLCLLVICTGAGRVHADTAYGYILPESGIRAYTEEEIADLPSQVLCYARNEIYARNGRMFRSAELQNYFSAQYWYTALYQPEQFTVDMLNTYEQQNLQLLTDRENALGTYTLDCEGYSYELIYAFLESEYDASYQAIDIETYEYDMAAESSQQDEEYILGAGALGSLAGDYAADMNSFTDDYAAGSDSLADDYAADPDSYIFYDSDRRTLSEKDTAGLSLQELCYARYEIYARRGRRFISRELSDYFEQKNWYWGYIASDSFSDSILNATESANVSLLQEAELALDPAGYQLDQPGYSFADIGSYTDNQSYTNSAEQYVIWDSSIRYLTEEEVRTLSQQQICYARNEIYARRGYIFQSRELRDYFGSKSWYHPLLTDSEFSSSLFNAYETANIELLRTIEYSENPNGYQLY